MLSKFIMANIFSLKDKIILVTGSSRGLGGAMAHRLAEFGATVIMNGRDQEQLKKSCAELKKEGLKVDFEAFDVADDSEAISGLNSIAKRHGGLDGLINNAGIQHRQALEHFALEDFDRLMNTNLRACFLLAREAARLMLHKGSGRIVNVASIMGPLARKSISAYTTSKAGIVGLTKALAVELGPQGICCNAIAPGFFATEMNTALVKDHEFSAFVENRTPLHRWGQPPEIEGAAVYLMSDASSYVNGHVLTVDGGLSCQV